MHWKIKTLLILFYIIAAECHVLPLSHTRDLISSILLRLCRMRKHVQHMRSVSREIKTWCRVRWVLWQEQDVRCVMGKQSSLHEFLRMCVQCAKRQPLYLVGTLAFAIECSERSFWNAHGATKTRVKAVLLSRTYLVNTIEMISLFLGQKDIYLGFGRYDVQHLYISLLSYFTYIITYAIVSELKYLYSLARWWPLLASLFLLSCHGLTDNCHNNMCIV